jgi:hypothetical protein
VAKKAETLNYFMVKEESLARVGYLPLLENIYELAEGPEKYELAKDEFKEVMINGFDEYLEFPVRREGEVEEGISQPYIEVENPGEDFMPTEELYLKSEEELDEEEVGEANLQLIESVDYILSTSTDEMRGRNKILRQLGAEYEAEVDKMSEHHKIMFYPN